MALDDGRQGPPAFTAVQKEKRPREKLGIRWQIAMGFGAFTLIIGVLLWVFQMTLLGPFYRVTRTAEVRRAAESLSASPEEEGEALFQAASRVCSGMNIVICNEYGVLETNFISSYWVNSPLWEVMNQPEPLRRMYLARTFEQVNLLGGAYLQERHDYPDQNVILCARIARIPSGKNRMVLVESEMAPVESTVDTLKVQLGCVTAVMILLGGLLAWFIARRIATPLASINRSAKALAQGHYEIRFPESGAREVSELAETLNYAAAELSKVEGLRRELLANVSHDLRTPLTMIQGYSEVMRDLPGENTPENVQIIIDETKRLTDLVNDLLDLSRLEAGVVSLDKTTFNLTESIRSILHRYDKLADYSFPFYAQGDVLVTADELKISQVVYNLVNNAITYAGEDKTVSLRQTVEGSRVRISVTDTGEGIPPDRLKDIWERYYKVDKEHRRAQVGTGLGLSIVKNILELHGGAYGVDSQPGQGSTFWFELALEQQIQEAAGAPNLPAGGPYT